MPVQFLNRPSGLYSTQEEADYQEEQRREQRTERTLQKLGTLAKAYQDYHSNKRNREIVGSLIGADPQAMSGPIQSGQAGIQMPSPSGGGSPQFIDPNQVAALNMQRGLPPPSSLEAMYQARTSPQSGNIFSRIGRSFRSGTPLSSLEEEMAKAMIKRQYPSYEDLSQDMYRQAYVKKQFQNLWDEDSDYNEEDIQYTMEKYGLTREEVLEKLNA